MSIVDIVKRRIHFHITRIDIWIHIHLPKEASIVVRRNERGSHGDIRLAEWLRKDEGRRKGREVAGANPQLIFFTKLTH